MIRYFSFLVIFLFFCKPEKLPEYKNYLYKPESRQSHAKEEAFNQFIGKISLENKVNFTEIKNPTAYIPPMCYTKTVDEKGKAHNPCYSCHTVGVKPNYVNDSDLQTHYDFPEQGKVNPWKNLFSSFKTATISDSEIQNYIRQSNYFDKGEIKLSKTLPKDWQGFKPDCYFNFNKEGFDKNPNTGELTGWRAYRYYPFLGTFWATNGSTDDVLIRLPFPFQADKNGKFNLEIYKTNLALIEALIKQKSIDTETLNEEISNLDLDENGKLEKSNRINYNWPAKPIKLAGLAEDYQKTKEISIAGGLFPLGTEFLHSVRYIDWNSKNNKVKLSRRMKELRYAQKREWYNYSELADKVSREKKDLRFRTEKSPEGFHGDFENGFDNKTGWVYQGFIEDRQGELRPQTNEETLFCMGCHSSLGVLADSVFSFQRKFEGGDKSKVDFGWGHWSNKDLSGIPDREVSFINFGQKKEYSFYLENNGAGDEFRENIEVKNIFFDELGTHKKESFDKLKLDVTILLNPSYQRSIALNKSYKKIVDSQSFRFGRDAILQKPVNVFRKVTDGQTTKIERIVF